MISAKEELKDHEDKDNPKNITDCRNEEKKNQQNTKDVRNIIPRTITEANRIIEEE